MSARPEPPAKAPLLSAGQLRQIIDGATDTAIISTDRTGLVTSWSLGAQLIFDWSAEEMPGQKLDRLFTEEDRKLGQLAREMNDALTHGRGGGEEGWRIRKDGSRMWAAREMSPVHSEAGSVIGFTKVAIAPRSRAIPCSN
jgi:PAS domain S-box-containing protein